MRLFSLLNNFRSQYSVVKEVCLPAQSFVAHRIPSCAFERSCFSVLKLDTGVMPWCIVIISGLFTPPHWLLRYDQYKEMLFQLRST